MGYLPNLKISPGTAITKEKGVLLHWRRVADKPSAKIEVTINRTETDHNHMPPAKMQCVL